MKLSVIWYETVGNMVRKSDEFPTECFIDRRPQVEQRPLHILVLAEESRTGRASTYDSASR